MPHRSNSVRTCESVSDEVIRTVLRLDMHRAINIDRDFTRAMLADQSGVSIHQIDQLLSQEPEKQRRVRAADAFSLAWVLGERTVNRLIGTMGYGGARPLLDAVEADPSELAGKLLRLSAAIAEGDDARQAADQLIAILVPISSAGGAA